MQKNRHLRTTAQGYIFATNNNNNNNNLICTAPECQRLQRHISTIRKKKLSNINISSTYSHNMVNFSSLTAETGWRVWGTPANFNWFRVLASSLHRSCSTEVNQITLHGFFCRLLGSYIYIFGTLAP